MYYDRIHLLNQTNLREIKIIYADFADNADSYRDELENKK